jgi:hypothetical protein
MNESNMVSLLVFTIQLLEASLLVEMNIDHYTAVQQAKCCDAAKRDLHGCLKK